jgi:hypothetical protein
MMMEELFAVLEHLIASYNVLYKMKLLNVIERNCFGGMAMTEKR